MTADRSTNQAGAGGPRSADTGNPGDGSRPDGELRDPAISTGARTSAHPTEQGAGGANRSGNGGSGGPGTGDPGQEGSTGQSMEELLTGDDDAAGDEAR